MNAQVFFRHFFCILLQAANHRRDGLLRFHVISTFSRHYSDIILTLFGVTNSHMYADDTQLYITFRTSSICDMESSKQRNEGCVGDINHWMFYNKLKLNSDKTEVLVISSSHRARPPLQSISVSDETVSSSNQAQNIGVIFDECLSMKSYVTATCKAAFYHLRNIARIRKYLSLDATKIIIHSLVTTKLDQGRIQDIEKEGTGQLFDKNN